MKSGTGSIAAPVSLPSPVLVSPPPPVLPELDASPLDVPPLDVPPLDVSPLDVSPLDVSPLDVSPLEVPLVVGADAPVLDDEVPAPPLELPSPRESIEPPLQPTSGAAANRTHLA